MNRKWIIFNIVVAVLCTGCYLICVPHDYQVFETNKETMVQTLEIIPLGTAELVRNAIKLFVLIICPSIIYIARFFAKKMIINR